MRRTETLDAATVPAEEITTPIGDSERNLQAGDTLIQHGNHRARRSARA